MTYRTPFQYADAYKLSHWIQYPDQVAQVYANFTARKPIHPKHDCFVFFGLQAFLKKLDRVFTTQFFELDEASAVTDFVNFYTAFFGTEPCEKQVEAVSALHKLGYLPLRFKALPEGSAVPHGVPVLTVINTHPEFAWMTNFVESWMSAEIWGPCTSATTGFMYRKVFDKYAEQTSDSMFMPPFQGHDFSFRGMWGVEAASMSGAGHLLSFQGTDTLPAVQWIEDYYPGSEELIGTSVPATEHSVMCAGGSDDEEATFSRLLELYPTGILSVVSDTWDFWKVVTEILPRIKDKIMARDGKLVIRPDSSPKTPVEIICGDPEAPAGTPAHKGLIRCLHDTFGGVKNSKGFIELDPHIGAIYGDSITLEYQEMILSRLRDAGFASTNVVLGIGSYTYQYVTRDTHGSAMKSTLVVLRDGTRVPIWKDPKTDGGTKKSHKGILAVVDNGAGYECVQNAPEWDTDGDLLELVWEDSRFLKQYTFAEVRRRLEAAKC